MSRELFIRIILVVLIVFSINCESVGQRETQVLAYTSDKVNVYEKYLVDPAQYTSGGSVYHKKYFAHLIGVARMLTEEKKLNLVEKSIGFYHDKKRKDEKKLYLGLDIDAPSYAIRTDGTYGQNTAILLKKYTPEYLPVVLSCVTLLDEAEIAGMVIGFRWQNGSKNESFNFWVDKKDARLYEANRLTLTEFIERNTITDASGTIVRLIK